MKFDSFKDLEKHLRKSISSAMANEVAEETKTVMQEEIETTVYDHYPNPKKYRRRYESGGLQDRRNMNANMVSDTELHVSNDAPLNKRFGTWQGKPSLAEIVITGEHYDWYGGAWEDERDFIAATVDALEQSNRHVKALKNGLQKNGISCK